MCIRDSICVVDIDKETGGINVRRFVAIDDCGHIINPMIVQGQVPVSYTHLTLPTSDLV